MSYSPAGYHPAFVEHAQTGLDSNNTATVSTSLDITGADFVVWNVQAATGTHGTHVITLQCSVDDSSWESTLSTLTGVGTKDNVQITARYVRLKVTTAESATSTVDIIIQAK